MVDVCPAEPSPHESEASDQMTHSPIAPPQTSKTDTASQPVTTQPETATFSPPAHVQQVTWMFNLPAVLD